MANKATIDKYETKAVVDEYRTKAVIDAYITKVTNIQNVAKDVGEQPISSIKTTAEFYNEIRLEEGYSDGQNVNPLTNFSDSTKPNASQATPSKQGEYVANDINGYPSILLDGVDDFYDMGDTYNSVFSDTFYICFVMKRVSISSRFQGIMGGIDSNNRIQLSCADQDNSALYFGYEANGSGLFETPRSYNPFVSAETPYFIVNAFLDNINKRLKLRLNGSEVQNIDITGSDVSNFNLSLNQHLGELNRTTETDTYPSNQKVAARVVSPANDEQDAIDAETKLNEKYAIY